MMSFIRGTEDMAMVITDMDMDMENTFNKERRDEDGFNQII